MVTGGDWVGGWDSPDPEGAGGQQLPANRRVALIVCCGLCSSSDIKVRSSAEGSLVTWFKCSACENIWKEAIRYERAIILIR